jgi:multicomponent Na+:H+ antiporter subunit B
LLLYATKDMPALGDGEAPANAYLGRAYLVRTPIEVGAPNVVTAVLASYRGYDTLGETVVIFTAGIGVMLLLGMGGRPRRKSPRALGSKPETGDGGKGEAG